MVSFKIQNRTKYTHCSISMEVWKLLLHEQSSFYQRVTNIYKHIIVGPNFTYENDLITWPGQTDSCSMLIGWDGFVSGE